MKLSPVSNNLYSFGSNTRKVKTSDPDYNPVSKKGEKAKLVKATFIAGLGLGTRLLFELADGDFLFDILGDTADSITKKQHKGASPDVKFLKGLGVTVGLLLMFIGAVAALYTLFKAPKINYDGNVNAFKNGKDMDVYIKGNSVEKELYAQMNNKAKTANEEEKEKLRQQYLQMHMAKNQIPEFVKKKQ